MEQREELERNTNDPGGSERPNVEVVTSRKARRRQISLGRVVARLQAASKELRDPSRNARAALDAPPAARGEEASDETAQEDVLLIDVTKWVRRLLIPLAVL